MIRFNFPHITGKEIDYIRDVINNGRLSGDGLYTKRCIVAFKEKFNYSNSFLTTSCTDALEMAALLMDIKHGDEVIMPSFTFVSTANAFVLRGASIVFADSLPDHPNIDYHQIEPLITDRTKAIVVVHYGGVSCAMNEIIEVARKYNLLVVEDAAQALGSRYHDQFLGTIGDYGTVSFHETKNIVCGEGGLLVVNDSTKIARAEIIREKGTNRTSFFRGEIDKYGWVDVGSSFLASEILAAFLFAQLEHFDIIQNKRMVLWNRYMSRLAGLTASGYRLPMIPYYAVHNAHIFYLICPTIEIRTALIDYLNSHGIKAVFHYIPLHGSKFYKSTTTIPPRALPNSEIFGDLLLRLPLFPDLTIEDQDLIIDRIHEFIKN
ncbi:MAG: dTDP-4-amino-4,6-dideoxygalactose transaminase [Cyclobacteriaceae bacterium]